MSSKRNVLYIFFMLACFVGYLWLFYNNSVSQTVDVCLIKKLTHLPCPSCGSTKAVISLIHGDFLKSLYINPFGVIITLFLLIAPLWILFDVTSKRSSLLDFYNKTEGLLKKPGLAIPLVLLVLMNWIWNITKGNF